MTIKIEIEVPSDLVLKGAGGMYLDKAVNVLGYHRTLPGQITPDQARQNADRIVSSVSQTAIAPDTYEWTEVKSETIVSTDATIPTDADLERAALANPNADVVPVLPKRERGKPSPGRARRTKEEIAEDEAADASSSAQGAEKQTSGTEVSTDAGSANASSASGNAQAAISTGGERISPEDEQDAADEAAETEKTGLASIDVLRRLVGDYQKKHGTPAAVKLCQEGGLIGKPIHELDDAGIEAAIKTLEGPKPDVPTSGAKPTTIAGEIARQMMAEEPAALEPKTKADLVEAMMRYADKFDGTRDQAKMTHTLADMPKIFEAAFKKYGIVVQKLSQVPDYRYAEAVAAVEAAIEADPYGRAK